MNQAIEHKTLFIWGREVNGVLRSRPDSFPGRPCRAQVLFSLLLSGVCKRGGRGRGPAVLGLRCRGRVHVPAFIRKKKSFGVRWQLLPTKRFRVTGFSPHL